MKTLRSVAVAELLATISDDSILRLSDGDTLRISAATLAFYGGRAGQAAWVGPKGLLDKGLALHQAVGAADDDGLPPVRYRHDIAVDRIARLESTGDSALSDTMVVPTLADLDLLLTEGFNRMARELVAGVLEPEEAGLDYRIVKDRALAAAILDRVPAGEAPADIVGTLRPTPPRDLPGPGRRGRSMGRGPWRAERAHGWGRAELLACNLAAIRAAFCEEDVKERIERRLRRPLIARGSLLAARPRHIDLAVRVEESRVASPNP